LTANTLELAPRASSADDFAGRTLGEFVLHDPIGRGGFGTVYRATQPALDREAVVKVLHPHLVDTSSAADRFLREARLASKLDHPYADPQPCARGSPSG
jgi:serine/threonine-protein kinase